MQPHQASQFPSQQLATMSAKCSPNSFACVESCLNELFDLRESICLPPSQTAALESFVDARTALIEKAQAISQAATRASAALSFDKCDEASAQFVCKSLVEECSFFVSACQQASSFVGTHLRKLVQDSCRYFSKCTLFRTLMRLQPSSCCLHQCCLAF